MEEQGAETSPFEANDALRPNRMERLLEHCISIVLRFICTVTSVTKRGPEASARGKLTWVDSLPATT